EGAAAGIPDEPRWIARSCRLAPLPALPLSADADAYSCPAFGAQGLYAADERATCGRRRMSEPATAASDVPAEATPVDLLRALRGLVESGALRLELDLKRLDHMDSPVGVEADSNR